MKKLWILVLLSFVLTVQAQDAAAPYLYYYSDVLNAFVIERADGTDSRTLGANLMPPETNLIYEAGWSPSGKWFAWGSSIERGGGYHPLRGQIISTDGTKRLDVFDHIGHFDQMAWSPTEDLLAVVENEIYKTAAFHLIDAQTGNIVVTFELDSLLYYSRLRWASSGEIVTFGRFRVLKAEDGWVLQKVERSVTFIREYISGESPLDWIIYRDDTDLTAEHLDTEEKIEFPIEPDERIDLLVWDESGQEVLVFIQNDCPDCGYPPTTGYRLLWLSTKMQKWQLIADDADFDDYTIDQQMMWSPDKHFILYRTIENELAWFDTMTFAKTIIAEDAARTWSWSAQSDRLVYQDNTVYQMLLYDVSSGETVNLVNLGHEHWTGAQFSPDGQSLAVDRSNTGVFILDLNSRLSVKIADHSSAAYASRYLGSFQWSSNSKWLLSSQIHFHSSGGGGPRAVMVTNRDQSIRRELSVYFGKPDWLPERVLSHLAPESSESVVLQPTTTLYHMNTVKGLSWNATGSQLATFTPDTLHIWEQAQEIRTLMLGEYDNTECNGAYSLPCSISWSPDNGKIAVNNLIYNALDGQLVETLAERQLVSVQWIDNDHFTINRYNISHSPDGRQVAQPEATQVTIADVESGQIITTVPVAGVWHIIWRGDWLWMQANEHHLWNTRTQTFLDFEPPFFYLSMTGMDISPDGRWLVGASIYGRLHIWDLTDGSLNKLNFNANDVTFSLDGRWLAAAGGQTVTLWDMQKIAQSTREDN